jgi:hypothetical protein
MYYVSITNINAKDPQDTNSRDTFVSKPFETYAEANELCNQMYLETGNKLLTVIQYNPSNKI